MSKAKTDAVNHPQHYQHPNPAYETIKIIEAMGFGFHLGNTFKYMARAPHKGATLEDLKKARWYLDREIANQVKRQAALDAIDRRATKRSR